LNDLKISITDNIDDADFCLFHGSQKMSNGKDISLYDNGKICDEVKGILERAKERDLIAICANRDNEAINPDGKIIYMPGLLKEYYESIKPNSVLSFGKPDQSFFEYAINRAKKFHLKSLDEISNNNNSEGKKPSLKPLRVLHIGDSLSHDILGAKLSNIDSCMITNHGVHYKELENMKNIKNDNNDNNNIEFQSMLSPPQTITTLNQKEDPLLVRVCDLCDKLNYPRPSYILETFKL